MGIGCSDIVDDCVQKTCFLDIFSQGDRVEALLGLGDDIRCTITSNTDALDDDVEPMLVILDTGIAIEETSDNLQKLRLLFRAVVDKRVGYCFSNFLSFCISAPKKCKISNQTCRPCLNGHIIDCMTFQLS